MIGRIFAWAGTALTRRALRLESEWRSLSAPSVGQLALKIASAEVGNGEIGQNNRGRHVAKYRGRPRGGAWCASFVGWCFEQTGPLSFSRSHGAKRLFRQIAAQGRVLDVGESPRAGDVFVLHRGPQGAWTGHIGFVAHGGDGTRFAIIDGNRGLFPSAVKGGFVRFDDPRLLGFARF